jgi:hypothetical protein
LRIVAAGGGISALGEIMKKIVLLAALVAFAAQPGWAAEKAKAKSACTPAAAMEAEQGLRFMTELGIASNACTSIGIYADFRVRNRETIVGYQKAMIAHLHGAAAFDKWNTVLANQMAQRQSSIVPAQFCQQSAGLLEQAKGLDAKGFRAYAAAQAAANTQAVKCGK